MATLYAPPASIAGLSHTSSNVSATASGYGGTARIRHNSGPNGLIDISVLFQNYDNNSAAGETFSASTISYTSVWLEYSGLGTGSRTQLFFPSGQSAFNLEPGATIQTVPTSVYIPPNTDFYIRYYATWPVNGSYCGPEASIYQGAGSNRGNMASPAATDVANASGSTSLSGQNPPGQPVQILGNPAIANPKPVIAIMGDSIHVGVTSNTISSSPVKACLTAGAQFAQLAMASDKATVFVNNAFSRRRMSILSVCHVAVCNYGTNDIVAGVLTYAAVKTGILGVCKIFGAMGIPAWWTTILPRTTGGVVPRSTQNQNTTAIETVRLQINAWIRAPYSSGAGNSLRYDAAQLGYGNVIVGICDSASYIETDTSNTAPVGPISPNNGGYWYTGPGDNIVYTSDGVHPNDTGYTLLTTAYDIAAIQASARPYSSTTSRGILGLTAY